MSGRNPQSRKPSDFNYPSSKEEERNVIDGKTERPTSSPSNSNKRNRISLIVLACGLTLLTSGIILKYSISLKSDPSVDAKYETLLRTAQLSMKNVNDTNSQLTAKVSELEATVSRLQTVEQAFVRACSDDPSISKLAEVIERVFRS